MDPCLRNVLHVFRLLSALPSRCPLAFDSKATDIAQGLLGIIAYGNLLKVPRGPRFDFGVRRGKIGPPCSRITQWMGIAMCRCLVGFLGFVVPRFLPLWSQRMPPRCKDVSTFKGPTPPSNSCLIAKGVCTQQIN